ncbi:MAG: EFR1 family ferrodoxin, partial [Clostridiales bacterium]|nr:EFR1 family ferrodoxin [Clostridiales bacterium]
IKRLKSKGFDVSNEYMLCMPSNFLTPTEENLAIKIIQILPIKCEEIVKDIVNNIRNKKRPFLIDKVMLSIAFFERIGAKIFGKLIKANGKCNSCGLCARECLVSNITMADNHPRFGWNCTICMHCLYNCPQDAIHARVFGSVVIKQGFDIKFYAKMAKEKAINDKIIITKNKHWSGVVKYLSDE